ncbi:MAG: transcriptional regulator, TetR-family [Herbaspirillum sp.]|jgi:TetR/AcrR family transcriptional repressor of nem operon|nr:transcriptional regulator, TetR-family [Herbaspirillum sp.]
MPRVSRSQTDKNRETIESVAGRLFREQGIDGISVAKLMQAAGLTHGGFYGHFDSKEALAAIACDNAFKHSAQKMRKTIDAADCPQSALAAIADRYLRCDHRDQPGISCPASSLAADVAREAPDKPLRIAYLDGIKQLLSIMATVMPSTQNPDGNAEAKPSDSAPPAKPLYGQAEQEAMMQLTVMVGAITLARATSGDPLSEALLAAARTCIDRIYDSGAGG